MTRVVITGTGVVSSVGNGRRELFDNLLTHKSAVRFMADWQSYDGLRSLVAAPARPYELKNIDRSSRRTMSPMSEMALVATKQALEEARLDVSRSDRLALCVGSTIGSPQSLYKFYKKIIEMNGPKGQLGSSFFKVMNHSVAANIAVDLKFKGAVMAPSAACATSTQALVMGFELLQSGLYDAVIVGGADELDFTSSAVFDIVGAASSQFNSTPERTPRPFDKDRDGLVVSEGAGILILETEEHCLQRGATPLAEIHGGAHLCDGSHMAHPDQDAMARVMRMALARSRLEPQAIDYINAHATGTTVGDLEELRATFQVFGEGAKVSSLKGHMGHSLAACGALETIACMEMLKAQKIIGTLNLANPDPEMPPLDLVQGTRSTRMDRVMVNNFAFGGISASLILSSMEART